MKLKTFSFLSYLTVACFSTLLISCDEPGDAGLELQQEEGFLNSDLIDTFNIEVSTILDNREIPSQNTAFLVVGAYNDADFGHVACATYFQLRLSEENKVFGSNMTCDSVKLFLDYFTTTDLEPHIYGDTTKVLPIEVFKLTEGIDPDLTYYTTSFVASESTPLGTANDFIPAPLQDQELEVNLGCTYGDELIANANQNNDEFLNDIHGLKVAAVDGTDASIIGFNATLDSSRVVLYYHSDVDTSTYNFDINSSSKTFNQIDGDLSSSVLAGLVEVGDQIESAALGNQFYLQSGTGVRALLKFPTVAQFMKDNGPITINKAEIIMNVVDGTTSGLHDEAPVLLRAYEPEGTLIKRDENNADVQIFHEEYVLFEALNFNNGQTNFVIDEEEQFVFPLTYLFEELAHGDRESVDLIVSPANNSTRVTNGRFYDANTTINGEKALKLKLYYTKLE